ncbi:MAG: hypothetical protein ACRDGE_08645 [Candidatus Limnocylindria bacterium]
MKLRLWPWRRRAEPAGEVPATEEPTTEQPTRPPMPPVAPEGEQTAPAGARPTRPASAYARPYAPGEEVAPDLPVELPAEVSLTLDEAKKAIRATGGDVIQIGFLANAYLRHREEEPASRETAAARERLCELVAKRLKDRKLLALEGRFELLESPAARRRTA